MQLRSQKQTSPPLKLIIQETVKEKSEKKALRKRNHLFHTALKRLYKISIRNVVL